ncbi:thyroid adenoma-associated protein isoform X2 [Rhinatrema bivittatum]|uniref:thyroid adenoma-associated protein isoform X2 n=1 Tax=Rhinatrema bivittatum TaxID=194408 RepID=UPI00112A8A23|nr:thyroid adenoma-associated protein isoform X2 [Rhinatrema bivittatum]
MVLKKKKEIQVDALVLDGPILEELLLFADAEGQNAASLLLHCVQLTDGVQQINCIKQIVPLLGKLSKVSENATMIHSCLDTLAVMYLSVDSKNPLKKVMSSSLNALPDQFKAEAVHSFTRRLREELGSTNTNLFRKVIENLASCMDNFSIGTTCITDIFMEVLQFLQKCLPTFQDQTRKLHGNRIAQTQLMNDLLVAVKVSMVLVSKMQENVQEILQRDTESPIWPSMSGMLHCLTNVLVDERLLQNIQCTSGLAVMLYTKIMLKPAEKLPCLVSDLLLRPAECVNAPDWFVRSCGNLCAEVPSDSVVLSLCQGALAMLEWRNGNMGQNGEKLLLDILMVLLTLSSRLKESNMAMSVSRILAIWTTTALDVLNSCSRDLKDSLNGNSDTFKKLLEYVYTHWEHPLDAVRHQCKAIFKNLLQIHQLTVDRADVKTDPFFSQLTGSLLALEWHMKGKYASLACLVECVGVESILAVDRTIPAQILDVMGDQSFAPYASNLLEALFVSHRNQLVSTSLGEPWIDQWHETWISPLLLILCEGNPGQTTYIIDYHLPKLLKCNPESLHYMVKNLQTSAYTSVGSCSNRGALGALMACLRTARAHGHLTFTDNFMWSDQVSTGLIKQGLVHRHDQVRMDTLGLLCESHRSTEIVSVEEMEMIKFCIKYNLSSQSPSVRQQICCLLKKLFFRIQESSQVLYKLEQNKSNPGPIGDNDFVVWDPSVSLQQYKGFMLAISNSLFEALFPGSSHPTRFSALTILGSIADIFCIPEGQYQQVFQLAAAVTDAHVEVLLECFTNSFEEVKLLAFELLRKLPDTVVYRQDSERLTALVQAALDLSTSAKHFDCVTASYLLNFLVYHQGLTAALCTCIRNQQPMPELHLDQSLAASTMEKNTLVVVSCLLGSLENEISQAERSLLQAAALFPMYGRVHCIIAALQQLPLRNLTMVTEWRQMVARLILMSYRISAIVSPVVHSSSPEGLIPMDTDTETAAQLQMILNEIQPRDTNDYFTQARLLREHPELESQKHSEENGKLEDLCTEKKVTEWQGSCVTAQMVLVCCWRSMKEISLLLGMLCQLLPLQTTPAASQGLITVEQVEEIGEYFKHHLLQSRHRGAFELAYVGFVKFTEMLIRCSIESLHCLPQQWLCNVLQEIKSSDPSSKLCATRRSAGIPFYIQALLASEPKSNKAGLLNTTMKELISLAIPFNELHSDVSTIPQVHALNILRALFRDARLSESIIPYVADGAQAAILGFTSPVWAVRNSSTLLFSTLITRIFGVKRGKDERSKKNRMTGREFFSRFPSLYPFLLKQLENVANTMDSKMGELKLHPSLFLLLLILSKLYPSPLDGTYSALSMASFVPFIMRCGHSPVYRSREMAARALVPFVMIDHIPRTILSLLAMLPDCTNPCIRQNHIHGTLLQVFHLLHSYFESKHRTNSDLQRELYDIIVCMKAKLWLARRQNPCLVTRAAYLDVLVILSGYHGKCREGGTPHGTVVEGFWEDISTVITDFEFMRASCHSSAIPGLTQYLQSFTRLMTSMLSVSVHCDLTMDNSTVQAKTVIPLFPVAQLLQSDFHEVRLLILEAVLSWMKQPNSQQLTKDYRSVLGILSGTEKILLDMAEKENNLECFCMVLKVLYHMDVVKVLLKAGKNQTEFLHRIMRIAGSPNYSVEIQSIALMLSSTLVIHLVQSCQEDLQPLESALKEWVLLLASCCEDALQTELKLAAAEVLVSITSIFLINQHLVLGLSDTLILWNCVFVLLQSEEPAVRDTAADVIWIHHLQQKNHRKNPDF